MQGALCAGARVFALWGAVVGVGSRGALSGARCSSCCVALRGRRGTADYNEGFEGIRFTVRLIMKPTITGLYDADRDNSKWPPREDSDIVLVASTWHN